MAEGTYTQHIQRIDSTLEQFTGAIQELRDGQNEIKQALMGAFGEGGLVKKVQEQDERVKELEEKYNQAKWLLVGVSAGSGGVVSGLIQWLI